MSSPDTDSRPVILLAFANDREGSNPRYLSLPEERRELLDALEPAVRAGIKVVDEPNATPERLFDLLGTYNDRIIGLHFGGHATGEALALEDRRGRTRLLLHQGLAKRIGGLPNLRWVCLNACGTATQIRAIHKASAVPVIATSAAILDSAAVKFARRFYHALAREASLREAFVQAEAEQLGEAESAAAVRLPDGSIDDGFSRMLRPVQRAGARWPWVLATRAGAEARAEVTLFDPLPEVADAGGPARRLQRLDSRWLWVAIPAASALLVGGALAWWLGRCDPPVPPSDATVFEWLRAEDGLSLDPTLSGAHRPGDMVQLYEASADGQVRRLPRPLPFMWSRDCFPDLSPERTPFIVPTGHSTRLGAERTHALLPAGLPDAKAIAYVEGALGGLQIEALGKGQLAERFSTVCVDAFARALTRGDAPAWYATLVEAIVADALRVEIGWACDASSAERERLTEAFRAALAAHVEGPATVSANDARMTVIEAKGRIVLGWRARENTVVE
ncbi:MAG: CHAT domain-containing protein [Myxococcales bacterium]|nr:CHAT domain-containing protein [Myxococcales bacterium]